MTSHTGFGQEVAIQWAHRTLLVHSRGRIRVVCCCGAQSPALADNEAVANWIEQHTRIKEVHRTVRDDRSE